jgi:hypothetical protein
LWILGLQWGSVLREAVQFCYLSAFLKSSKTCDIQMVSIICPNFIYWQEHQKKVKLFFFTFFRQHSPCSDFTDFLKIQFRLYLRSKRDSKIGVFGGTPYPRCSIFWHTGMTRSAGIAAIRAPWSHNKDGSNGQGRHSCHSHQ